ncbi:MAG: hypothetical protein HYR85_22385 [Planctomycetes bacterium]|nr:hypothetical protein [Planctomycetota bacterium]MBI3844141.1 hypothetical protein [Planctomycetota bacterium]
MTENPSSPAPNTRPMRHRWVHIVFGFFAASIFLVVFILALSLPEGTEDREVTAWVFTGVQTFILGTWVLFVKWLNRRAEKNAAAAASAPLPE